MIDADGDGAKDDRKLTLPDDGTITLLNLGSAALVIDDFTFAVWNADRDRLIIVDPEQEGDGDDTEQEESTLQQHIDLANTTTLPNDGGRSRLQELITNGGSTGRLDAGDLSISGGVNLPASDDGAHRSSYHLYYDADGGSYFLRFDDDRTADLPISADAPQVDAALEGLNGISSAEVTGEPGDFTITLIADEPHVLQWSDVNLGGDGGLDYLG